MGQCGSKDLFPVFGTEIKLLDGSVSLKQLVRGTENFSSKMEIGIGLYKANLQDQIFAVERINRSVTSTWVEADEFYNEINFLSSLKHENLLQLLGGYYGNSNVLAIYEYMENYFPLDFALLGGEARSVVDWETRYNICLGIAKGLKYLHEDSGHKFIHGNISAYNIILDDTFKAKIYVGLNLVGVAEESQQFIRRLALISDRGLIYKAPEYALNGTLTVKADVYSFGVLLLEIVSGRKDGQFPINQEPIFLIDVAYNLNAKGRLMELIDKRLSRFDAQQVILILKLALKCTSASPSLRPSMSEVLRILEGKITIDQTPAPATQPSSGGDNIRSEAYKLLTSSTYFNCTRKVTSTKLRSYF